MPESVYSSQKFNCFSHERDYTLRESLRRRTASEFEVTETSKCAFHFLSLRKMLKYIRSFSGLALVLRGFSRHSDKYLIRSFVQVYRLKIDRTVFDSVW